MDDQTEMRREPPAEARAPRDARSDETPEERARSPRARVLRLGAGVVVALSLIVGGALYWLHARHFESTDDAFIDAYQTQMAARVAGQVTELSFADNQHVTQGQVLLRIDPRDFQAKLDQAQAQLTSAGANLQQAQAQALVQQANVRQANANLSVTQADLVQAKQDFERFKAINPNAVTRQQIDTATATYRAAQARLDANTASVGAAEAQAQAAQAQVASGEAAVQQAKAGVEAAALQLSYCTVTAPMAGVVTHRTVSAGNYVAAGQPLFALVQDGRWVTANFKETQLTDMQPGQAVDLVVDAIPGTTFRGKIDSFQAGTGTVFSALPAENATGNYVKIVQRVPVKIVFDDDRLRGHTLAPGMSVVPSVRVR
jgi:membrane fusion protein, multidrug efflux system